MLVPILFANIFSHFSFPAIRESPGDKSAAIGTAGGAGAGQGVILQNLFMIEF